MRYLWTAHGHGQNDSKDHATLEVDILVALIRAQPVVDIENVVRIFVVVAIIAAFGAGLSEDTSRVVGGLISERGVHLMVGLQEVGGETFEGLLCVLKSEAGPKE